jgi:hypothetical protein
MDRKDKIVPTRKTLKTAPLAGLLLLTCSPAIADAIDGDWCSPNDELSLSINGSNLTTPMGNQITGTYSRHAFSYTIPEGEPNTGAAVSMRMLNDDEVSHSLAGGAPEIWRRCTLSISFLFSIENHS